MDLSIQESEWGKDNMKVFDEKDTNIKLTKADFEFVHKDDFGKIHDEKFKTKSTTFFKDALKRFAKNKSSVVAAIIIAILLLGSFIVPAVSPYNTSRTQESAFKKLPPKIVNPTKNTNGFWDGTITMESSLDFDEELNEYVPAETDVVKVNAYVRGTLKIHDTEYYDFHKAGFYGGYVRVSSRRLEEFNGDNFYYYENYNAFKLSDTSGTKVSILMNDTNNAKPNSQLGEYRIRLAQHKGKKQDSDIIKFYDLVDWTSDYPTDPENPLVLDLSSVLGTNEELNYCTIRIEGKPSSSFYSYILLEKIDITCADEEYVDETLKHISLEDANATMLKKVTDVGCWVSNGELNAYQCKYSKVTFRYDLYEEQLGLKRDFVIGKSIMDQYIANGWCKYDYNVGPSSFEKLSEECPITEYKGVAVKEQIASGTGENKTYQLTCNVTYYRYLGYKSMPSFFLGTDASGRALFTHALRCLKNSLAVSIICCAITIIIGLIWGSISGYYGGTVDLVMERISDILYGVPTTVVLTLVLLLMGRTLVTFAFAVCLTGWIGTAALTRTQMYRFKNRESVFASRTLGASDARLIFRHILPNSLGTIVTASVLKIPGFVFTEASLAFLKLGLDSGDSFGVLLSNNQALLSERPILTLFPAFLLCLLMISFNLFGNGLRDALNPTLKGGEQ